MDWMKRHVPKSMEDHREVLRRVARGWIIVGSLVVLFIGAISIAHFFYGVPIHNRNTGQPSTPEETRAVLLFISSGGAFFVAMGAVLYWCIAEAKISRFWVRATIAVVVGYISIIALHGLSLP
jgi:hypothetical protein